MLEWSDLRIFLAVARAGSTLKAARELGMNQTTISRRVDALEHQFGLTLFARRRTGYCPTEHGRALIEGAGRVEAAAKAVEDEAERLRRLVSGLIRMTAPESIFAHLLAPIVVAFRKAHPEVQIEQVSSEAHLDIEGGEVDIAFRATESPIAESLIGRRLPDIGWTLYSSRAYAAEHGAPDCPAAICRHAAIVYEKSLGQTPRGRWMTAHVDPARVVARSNAVPNMRALIKASLGVGLLPCVEGDDEPELMRCFGPIDELTGVWWLLMTPEVQRIAAVRRFADFAAARLRTQRRYLRGERG